jgi:CRISPR-associated protein Cas1
MSFGYWHSVSRLPISQRIGFVCLEKGYLEKDGHALVFRQSDFMQAIPVGQLACILLGAGTVVTRDAVALCADRGCLLLWTGDGGVRVYSAGLPGGASPTALLRQAQIITDPAKHLHAARQLFALMFQDEAPITRSIEQLRGLEGARVKQIYKQLADQYKVKWTGRNYQVGNPNSGDPINQALTYAHQALYGMAESAILALGYSPALGIVHQGDARSLVYDVADVIKFETSAPLAFETVSEGVHNLDSRIRLAFRKRATEFKILPRLVGIVQSVFGEVAQS